MTKRGVFRASLVLLLATISIARAEPVAAQSDGADGVARQQMPAGATTAGDAHPAAVSPAGNPQADPEHARLDAMCGTWDIEMTLWLRPGGPGVSAAGTSTIRPLFDGLFVEEKIDASLNGAPVTTLAWTGFNTASGQYEATRIASTNPGRIAETGVYDERNGQFELQADYPLAGEMWHQRTVIRMTSADEMVATSYLSFAAVTEWKGVEIRYTRR